MTKDSVYKIVLFIFLSLILGFSVFSISQRQILKKRAAAGNINVNLQPSNENFSVGEEKNINIYLVQNENNKKQISFADIKIIFNKDIFEIISFTKGDKFNLDLTKSEYLGNSSGIARLIVANDQSNPPNDASLLIGTLRIKGKQPGHSKFEIITEGENKSQIVGVNESNPNDAEITIYSTQSGFYTVSGTETITPTQNPITPTITPTPRPPTPTSPPITGSPYPTSIPSPTPTTTTPRTTPTQAQRQCWGGCYTSAANCATNCGRSCEVLSYEEKLKMCGEKYTQYTVYACCEELETCACQSCQTIAKEIFRSDDHYRVLIPNEYVYNNKEQLITFLAQDNFQVKEVNLLVGSYGTAGIECKITTNDNQDITAPPLPQAVVESKLTSSGYPPVWITLRFNNGPMLQKGNYYKLYCKNTTNYKLYWVFNWNMGESYDSQMNHKIYQICGIKITSSTPTLTPPTPTSIPTRSPTLTPTPTSTASQNNIVLNFKVAFKGVKEPAANQRTKKVSVKVVKDNLEKTFNNVDVAWEKDNVFSGRLVLNNIVASSGYSIFIKGPQHLAKKFCVNNQTTRCGKSPGSINLVIGENNYDFSQLPLEPGDLPGPDGQDGVVNSKDFSYWKTRYGKNTPEDIAIADVNFDNIITTQDWNLIRETLSTKYEEDY